MTTLATDTWKRYMDLACGISDYPSSVFSGIVGDKAHTNGYHLSIEDNPKGNYSVILPNDAAPPGNWPRNTASAGDRSMSTQDMIRAWNRWYAVYLNRDRDPRARYVRAYNGWNGTGAAERLDFAKGTRTNASSDHKWHDHREGYRKFCNDPQLVAALISIERGESVEQYLAGNPSTPPVSLPTGHAPGTRELFLTSPQMSGEDVHFVQTFIGEAKCGRADGFFGPNTERGVRWYQEMRGIGVDGRVGKNTWSNMGISWKG